MHSFYNKSILCPVAWTNLCKAEKEADSSQDLQSFWGMLEHL